MRGKVYLVGAGPGDPSLLTLKGKSILEKADCVVYDFLANEALLGYVRPGCEKVYAGKRAGRPAVTQERLNRLLIEKALEGSVVVRLKGGDPFIFGRGGEEALALAKARIPFEIVPGVSSGYAVPAYAGIPVTHRNWSSSVSFIFWRANSESGEPDSPLPGGETLVFFMGARNLPAIVEALLAQGRDPSTPIALIRWGTLPCQEVVTGTLRDIAVKGQPLASPTVAVVGRVVNLRKVLRWYEGLPLFGKRIVVTRARAQAAPLRDALAALGAVPVELPTIEVRDPESWGALDAAIERIGNFDYLLVTSVNGVRNFLARLWKQGKDARDLKGIQIGAIGPATAAEFAAAGVRVDFIPSEYRAEGLIGSLGARHLQGKSFLIPRARVARDLVPSFLKERGARVEVVEAYYTAMPEYLPTELAVLLTPRPDVLTFTSSSTARNFASLPIERELRNRLASAKTASIGPATSATLGAMGMPVDIEAGESTIPGLVRAIEDFFQR